MMIRNGIKINVYLMVRLTVKDSGLTLSTQSAICISSEGYT